MVSNDGVCLHSNPMAFVMTVWTVENALNPAVRRDGLFVNRYQVGALLETVDSGQKAQTNRFDASSHPPLLTSANIFFETRLSDGTDVMNCELTRVGNFRIICAR